MTLTSTRRRVTVGVAALLSATGLALASPAAQAATSTAYGAAVKPTSKSEPFPAALARSEQTYGRLGVIRYFSAAGPESWSTLGQNLTDHTAVVSWKYAPTDVIAGRYDGVIRSWFAHAPTDHITYYSYIHEPEDNIKRGEFTAADYRAAWVHIAALQHTVGNPMVRSNLIMQCYTTNPASHRNWRDYYAGPATIDVLGWDCYNHGTGRTGSGYQDPANLIGTAIAASHDAGRPWGIAEFGTLLVNGDTGAGRAQWLTAVARYLDAQGAAYVSYFDTNGDGTDYRLQDSPSKTAWRNVVSDQTP